MTARLYGLIAEFENPAGLVAATRTLHAAGVDGIEAYTPYPVDALDPFLAPRPSPVPAIILMAGVCGVAGGFLLQLVGMKWGYPLNVGGRPLDSWPAFIPSTYELGVLVAVLVGFAAYAAATRLTVLFHPILGAPGFEGASQDRFMLAVEAGRPGFDRDFVEALLRRAGPHRLAEIPE